MAILIHRHNQTIRESTWDLDSGHRSEQLVLFGSDRRDAEDTSRLTTYGLLSNNVNL